MRYTVEEKKKIADIIERIAKYIEIEPQPRLREKISIPFVSGEDTWTLHVFSNCIWASKKRRIYFIDRKEHDMYILKNETGFEVAGDIIRNWKQIRAEIERQCEQQNDTSFIDHFVI